MNLDYRYVIERRVAEYVVVLPRARARQLMAFFEYLARNPALTGGEWAMDANGRRNEALLFGSVTLVYWTDHAVREVRIVDVIED
jgi:hypothetical protein